MLVYDDVFCKRKKVPFLCYCYPMQDEIDGVRNKFSLQSVTKYLHTDSWQYCFLQIYFTLKENHFRKSEIVISNNWHNKEDLC